MPQCARCSKSVFPVEELKCLDKTWHKGCFKCSECGMTLNMKTYKGFNKMPYCEAHIPKAKATTVADTPEMKRIQENTKNQSNAVYHADFEKSKGKFTPVTDDPELMRLKQNSRIISNVTYHGDLEKKSQMEQRRNLTGDGGGVKNGFGSARSPTYMDELSSVPAPAPPSANYGASRPTQPPQYQPPPPSSNSAYRNQYQDPEPDYDQHHQQQQPNSGGRHKQDRGYQQQQQGMNASPYSSRGNTNVVYSSNTGAVTPDSPRKVGSIADYDPLNNYYGSVDHQQQRNQGPTGRIPSSHGMRQPQTVVMKQTPPQQQHQHQQQQQQQNYGRQQQQQDLGICYRALYDYEAQDVDEVSFKDGDMIIECSTVDEGWMTGTVHRTGMRGMLPANYVGQV